MQWRICLIPEHWLDASSNILPASYPQPWRYISALFSAAALLQSTPNPHCKFPFSPLLHLAQISMSEVFPPSPRCLTTPESEEKPGCSSGKLLGKPCWPWVVSLENLSAILRWFCPTYHIRSPAKHCGLTRISLDFLRIAMNSFFFFNVSKHKICAWHPAE